jgi:hypothetical protein
MLLTPHIVRTHELTVDDLAPMYIGTQQNVGLTGPPPLIQPPGAEEPAAAAAPAPAQQPGAITTPTPQFLPPPPGTPTPQTAVPPPAAAPVVPPGGVPPSGGAPPATGVPPPVPTLPPATPPRDVTTPTPPTAPTAPPGSVAMITVTAPQEFRVAGGPYTVPLAVANASRLSMITLTVTFNPQVLRVRNVQEGTFMRQGGVTASFTPRIDVATGRVDIAVTRTGDQAGVSGAGLLAALLFDAVGPGNSLIQVSGVASTPEGAALPLQFTPTNVTVR